ncbi:hypothetical protein [Sulfitobacter sp. 1A15299]|uniref:hypothetical protein n=1 Tax=Sulfitobacter sp. 1A15299 TaxID=3368598 RepID=UPI0037450010
MRMQNRRVTDLETKAGTGVDTITSVVTEFFVPSPDGPLSTGQYRGHRVGISKELLSLPGETKGAFERRIMEQEITQ